MRNYIKKRSINTKVDANNAESGFITVIIVIVAGLFALKYFLDIDARDWFKSKIFLDIWVSIKVLLIQIVQVIVNILSYVAEALNKVKSYFSK